MSGDRTSTNSTSHSTSHSTSNSTSRGAATRSAEDSMWQRRGVEGDQRPLEVRNMMEY